MSEGVLFADRREDRFVDRLSDASIKLAAALICLLFLCGPVAIGAAVGALQTQERVNEPISAAVSEHYSRAEAAGRTPVRLDETTSGGLVTVADLVKSALTSMGASIGWTGDVEAGITDAGMK